MKSRICIVFLFLHVIVTAQEDLKDNFQPPANPMKIKAFRTAQKIHINGVLDEMDWQKAEEITNFFKVEPVQGGRIRNRTVVKVLFDDKNLYFGVFATDSLGKKGLRIQDLRRDFNRLENDVFGIQIDAQNTKQYTVSFRTTPYGNQLDLQNFNGSSTDTDWNALWSVRTSRTKDGYYAEFAIPFKSIRYDKPVAGEPIEWGITFYRLARRDFEKTVFPAIPQSFSENRMTYAAKLVGLQVPPPSQNIRVEPYALYQYNENSTGDRLTDKLSEPKVGADVKWAMNPNAVLDLTINTDFAQADVDRAVNNLERFNIFFPERRQFFLENSGIWAGRNNVQVRPFFSRTIGLENTFNAAPAPLDLGARYTDRNENRTIAALAVRQRDTENSPGSTFGVGRFTKNYAQENNIGAMVTYRRDDSSSNLGIDSQNNTTLSIDGLIRPKSELTFSYLLSTSFDSATNETGFAGHLQLSKRTNKYFFRYTNAFISEEYAPDMGFVFQKNVMYHTPGAYAILRPKWLPFVRRWDPGSYFYYYHDFEDFGNFQQSSLYLFPIYTWFRDNSFLEVSFTPTWQNIDFDFAPLGLNIEQGSYSYTRYLLRYNSDRSKKLSGSGRFEFGKFYNGTRNTLNLGFRYAPLPHVSLTADYENNNINGVGIAQDNLDTDLYTASLRLALNPRVQLSTFYQYNSFDEQGRWNVRFSWEYLPLSFIYIIFNDTQTDFFDPVQSNMQFISKITLLKQF